MATARSRLSRTFLRPQGRRLNRQSSHMSWNEPVLHKTFHSYTVRKAQGGTQSSKDNKGTHSKSAGSSLRRYNEQSLSQHIQELMKSWGPEIIKCDFIFYRAVGRGNMASLFCGTAAPLLKADPRLRTIPFPTRRPTFNEVVRVHSLLAMAFIYDSTEMFKTTFSPPRPSREESVTPKNKEDPECSNMSCSPKKSHIDRAKERPSPVRELPGIVQQLAAISTSGSEGDTFFLTDEEISFVHLKEYDDTVPQEIKDRINAKRRKKKKKTNEVPVVEREPINEQLQQFWKAVHESCCQGDVQRLEAALDTPSVTKEEVLKVINQKNIRGETVLHQMAGECQSHAVRLLLSNGADPCIKDEKTRTPYDHANDKTTRNVFRRFMGEFPDLHDYSKTHIPSPLTDEIEAEANEKRRAARKVKRMKTKERKEEMDEIRKEEEEKNRFLSLSDREKRALAAEKRIQAVATGTVLSRCFACAIDITGKVPFEYNKNRFCTMSCLKQHRLASSTTLS